MAEQERDQSGDLIAAIVATLVVFGGLAGLGLVGLTLERQAVITGFEQMGFWAYGVLAAGGVATVGCIVALLMLGLKPRLAPAALFVVLATLPWLVGMVATLRSMEEVAGILQNVNPLDRVTISAAAFRESLTSRVFGAGFSAALLAFTGLGLGAGTLVARLFRSFRTSTLLATAGLCVALALAIASVSAPVVVQRRVFEGLSSVGAERAPLLALTAAGIPEAERLALLGPVALVLAVVAGVWAGRREDGRLSPGRALAVVLGLAPAVGLHVHSNQHLPEVARELAAPFWASTQDFQPSIVAGGLLFHERLPALITRTPLVQQEVPIRRRNTGEPQEGMPQYQPELTLAVDARVEGAQLSSVVEAAQAAGVRSLRFVGLSEPDALSATLQQVPVLAPYSRTVRVTPRVGLPSALPPGLAEQDAVLWHARLLTTGPVTVVPRPGAGVEPMTVDLTQPLAPLNEDSGDMQEPSPQARPVWLAIEPGTTAEHTVRVVERLARRSTPEQPLVPILTGGSLPDAAWQPYTVPVPVHVTEDTGE